MSKGKPRYPKVDKDLTDEARAFWNQYFCGCGDSTVAMEAFREIMELFDDREEYAPSLNFERWNAYAEKKGLGLTYLILYWLDGMRLTDHGGSVGGSWMTPLGEFVRLQSLTCSDSDDLSD